MGLLDQKTSHVADLVLLDEGTEVQFLIIEASLETGKESGREFFNLTLELPDNPNASLIYTRVMGIMESDEARKADNMIRRLKMFKQGIGLDPDDVIATPEALVGLNGFCIVGVEDTDTGKRNTVQRYSVSQESAPAE